MTALLPFLAETQNAIDRFFLPPPASNLAPGVDWAWNFVLGVSAFFFTLIVGVMLYFIIRYRRRTPDDPTPTITHNTPLEIAWTVIPLILVLAIFFIGAKGFENYDTPASDALPIECMASQWKFDFTYPNGADDANLYLLKGQAVVLNIQSSDVLHGVYIPAFRTQRNAVPGRTTRIWFIPTVAKPPLGDAPGFDLFCTQYCGKDHSEMHANVYVYDDTPAGKAAYEQKMIELNNPFKETVDGKSQWIPYAQVGEKLYHNNCAQCHTIDGGKNTGPTWKGLYKSHVTFSESNVPGYTLSPTDSDAKWDAYFMESILHPSAKIVSGFSNQMSDFTAQFTGSPAKLEKVRALIAFIKSDKVRNPATPYKPKYNPKDNPELYDADKNKIHPESLAFEKAAATQSTTAPAK